MTVVAFGISASTAILMLYSGLLFDPVLIRKQATRHNLHSLGFLSLVNYIMIPLATLLLVRLLPTTPDINLVLLTLAMMPCAPLVPALVSVAKEPPQWSLFVFLIFSLLSILMLPVLVVVLPQTWAAGNHARLDANGGASLALYILSVYVPLLLGIAFRLFDPARGLAALKLLRPLVPVSLLVALLMFIHLHQDEILGLRLQEISALLSFELVCVAIAFIFGPRQIGMPMTNILPSAFRNFAMGLALSSTVFSHTKASIYMVAFTILTLLLIISMLAVRWLVGFCSEQLGGL